MNPVLISDDGVVSVARVFLDRIEVKQSSEIELGWEGREGKGRGEGPQGDGGKWPLSGLCSLT
jgi:hypothetical protein